MAFPQDVQAHPEKYSDNVIMAEIRKLHRLQRIHGHHDLRALAALDLIRFLEKRQAKAQAAWETDAPPN